MQISFTRAESECPPFNLNALKKRCSLNSLFIIIIIIIIIIMWNTQIIKSKAQVQKGKVKTISFQIALYFDAFTHNSYFIQLNIDL